MGEIVITETSTIETPSVGKVTIAPKTDGKFYSKNSDGVETPFGVPDDADTSLVKDYHVAKNGNDTTGEGTISKPFLTIGACITYINANETLGASDNAVIMVAAGNYVEDALVLPQFCSLFGRGYRTRITASSPNINLLQLSKAHTVRDILLSGVTSTAHYHITIISGDKDRIYLQSIAIAEYETTLSNLSNGIYINCSSGEAIIKIQDTDFDDLNNNLIEIDNNIRLDIRGVQIFECPNGTFLEANNNCSYSIIDAEIKESAIGVNHKCTGDSSATSADFRNAAVPLIKANSGKLVVSNVLTKSPQSQLTNFSGLQGFLYDEIEGEPTIRFSDEVSVGFPGGGRETCMGEGDSYAYGVKVYTYDGITFVDKTTEAASSTNSTFTFPSSGATRSVYISSLRTFEGSTTPLKWYGIKALMDTAASDDGEIIAEYWNGSSWVEFTTLSTQSSGSFFPYGNTLFQRAQSEQIRFNDTINSSWAISNPASLSVSTYWIRFRCVTIPTTLPVFQQIKVHSNRSEINADGFLEYFGKARPVRSITLPNFEAANNSPANADIYFQDNFGVGKVENLFEGGSLDQASQIIYLPSGIDTSCPIQLNVVMFSSWLTTQTDWTIRWIVNRSGDPIHNTTSDAPTTNPRVQSKNISISPPDDDVQFTLKVDLDVSDYIAFNDTNTPDVLGIQIQRNGNTDENDSDMTVAVVQVFFTAWSQGRHL